MSEKKLDRNVDEFLEIREPGVHLEVAPDPGFVLDMNVDLTSFKKFPRVDDGVTYEKKGRDTRGEIDASSKLDLPDYSGPFRHDLRFTDFSHAALLEMLGMSHEYYGLLMNAWANEIALRRGEDAMREIQAAAWGSGVLPHVSRIVHEWMPFDIAGTPDLGARVVAFTPFEPDSRFPACGKAELVKMLLGSHEFLLLVIESWATQIVLRYGLDEMFDIQWMLWGAKALPGARDLKNRWMKVSGGDTTAVEAFMKDIQIDATAYPGKAFECTFEMPERNVGIMTFNKCVAADQWEALGRPDILEKNCHSTCPASLIETAKMYDPNMKIDILAIPPRKSKDHVCCKWKLSMRSKDDPEFVPVPSRD